MVGGFAVVGVTALALLVWRDAPPTPLPDTGGPMRIATGGSASLASVPSAAASNAQEQRAHVPASPNAPAPGMAVLRGACVDAESWTPLAGCTVQVTATLGAPMRVAAWDGRLEDADRGPWATTSAADGTFTLRFVPLPPYDYVLKVTAPGRVAHAEDLGAVTPGERDLGTIELAAGFTAHGFVVDEQGRPRPGLRVHTVRGLPQAPLPSALSDDAGRFAFAELLPAGPHELQLQERDHEIVGATTTIELPRDAAAGVQLVVRPLPHVLRGTVADTKGVPVTDLLVRALDAEDGEYVAADRTDERGRFVIGIGSSREVRLQTSRRLAGEGTERFVAGRDEARLVVLPLLALDLRVVDARTGAPVERFLVSTDGQQATGGRHPEGRVRLEFLEPGMHALVVWPGDEGLAPSPPRRVEVVDGGAVPQLEVALSPPVAVDVQLVRADGSELAPGTVELLHGGRHPLSAATRAVPPPHEVDRDGRFSVCLLLQTGSARARLRVPPGWDDLALRVHGPGHATHVEPLPSPVRPGELRIVVPDGATVRGRVAPTEWIARSVAAGARPAVLARTAQQPIGAPPQQGLAAEIADDGSFTLRGLPAGRCELFLAHPGEGRRLQAASAPVADLTLAADETRDVQLDVGAHVPVFVSGTIRVDGEPQRRVTVDLVAMVVDGGRRRPASMRNPVCRTDANGAFTSPPLPPGSYNLRIVRERNGRQEAIVDDRWFEVPPGGEVRRTFDLVARAVRLRVRDAEGRAVPHAVVRAANDAFSAPRLFETDGQGALTIPSSPPGIYVVEFFGWRRGRPFDLPRRSRATFEVDAAQRELEVEVRLQPPPAGAHAPNAMAPVGPR